MRLFGYQQRWLADRSKRRALVKARRLGGSFGATLDHSAEAAGFRLPFGQEAGYDPASGIDQVLISTGERAAQELITECERHLRAIGETVGETIIAGNPTQERIKLKNGRQILSLPSGNLSALVGWGGSLLVDECARVPNMELVARDAFPVASPSARYPRGGRISLVSSPAGPSGYFYDAVNGERADAWSQHRVTLWDALDQGFPRAMTGEERAAYVEDLRHEEPDPLAFAMNYECSFVDMSGAWIPSPEYRAAMTPLRDFPPDGGTAVTGFDYGEQKDASAAVEGFVDQYGTLWIHASDERRHLPADKQRVWLCELARRSRNVQADATGPGGPVVREAARQEHGIAAVTFTSQRRTAILDQLRHRFLVGKVKIADHLEGLQRAVLSAHVQLLPSGDHKVVLPRTKTGHADPLIALALANWGARSSHGASMVLPIRGFSFREWVRSSHGTADWRGAVDGPGRYASSLEERKQAAGRRWGWTGGW